MRHGLPFRWQRRFDFLGQELIDIDGVFGRGRRGRMVVWAGRVWAKRICR